MAFDWTSFSQGLQRTAGGVQDALMQKAQRQEEEKLRIEQEKRAVAAQKEMAKFTSDLDTLTREIDRKADQDFAMRKAEFDKKTEKEMIQYRAAIADPMRDPETQAFIDSKLDKKAGIFNKIEGLMTKKMLDDVNSGKPLDDNQKEVLMRSKMPLPLKAFIGEKHMKADQLQEAKAMEWRKIEDDAAYQRETSKHYARVFSMQYEEFQERKKQKDFSTETTLAELHQRIAQASANPQIVEMQELLAQKTSIPVKKRTEADETAIKMLNQKLAQNDASLTAMRDMATLVESGSSRKTALDKVRADREEASMPRAGQDGSVSMTSENAHLTADPTFVKRFPRGTRFIMPDGRVGVSDGTSITAEVKEKKPAVGIPSAYYRK